MTVRHCQHQLLQVNVDWLRQASNLLQRIDDRTYAEPPAGLAPHRVGAHLRHILEFYECFLAGLEWSHIDYDARKRDQSVETSRSTAIERIRSIVNRLLSAPELNGDSIIFVRMEDAPLDGDGDPFLTSSIGRELQVLSSHTIHHFALIAVTLQAHGLKVDADFGTAPSTLRYRAVTRAKSEAA